MSTEYTLSNTAANIDSALTRVVSADTSPTNASQNMVTSGGVKAAIDAIGSGSTAIITVDSFTNAALEDSDDGLTATDDAVPTSKAVKDYIDNQNIIAIYGITATYSNTSFSPQRLFLTEISDPKNIGSVNSNGVITLQAGTYQVSAKGNLSRTIDGGAAGLFFRQDGVQTLNSVQTPPTDEYYNKLLSNNGTSTSYSLKTISSGLTVNHYFPTVIMDSSSSTTFDIIFAKTAQTNHSPTLNITDFKVVITKIV